MATIWAAIVEYYDPAGPSTGYNYYCTGRGFTAAAGSEMVVPNPAVAYPNDYTVVDLSGVTFAPIMKNIPTLRFDYSPDGLIYGTGLLELMNDERSGFPLDALMDLAFEGRLFQLYRYDDTQAVFSPFGGVSAELMFRAALEQPETDGETVRMKIRSKSYEFEKPLQTHYFDGTGGSGGTSDMAGRVRPYVFGYARNFKPVLVDPTKNIYQISARRAFTAGSATPGEFSGYRKVRDAGVEYTFDSLYASTTDLWNDALAPAAGHYKILHYEDSDATDADRGHWMRLTPAGALVGDVTMDFFNRNPDCDDYKTLVATLAGWDFDTLGSPVLDLTQEIDTWDVNVNQAPTATGGGGSPAGLFVDEPKLKNEVMREVLYGINATIQNFQTRDYHSSGANYWGFRWLTDPSNLPASSGGYATATIDGHDIAFIRRTTATKLPMLPYYRFTAQYGRNYDPLKNIASSVTGLTRKQLEEEWLTAGQADTSVKTAYPNAIEMALNTHWAVTGGNWLSNFVYNNLQAIIVKRDVFELRAKVAPADLWNLCKMVIGDKLTIANYARYRCNVSRDVMVVGYEIDFAACAINLTVWG